MEKLQKLDLNSTLELRLKIQISLFLNLIFTLLKMETKRIMESSTPDLTVNNRLFILIGGIEELELNSFNQLILDPKVFPNIGLRFDCDYGSSKTISYLILVMLMKTGMKL